MSEPFFDYIAKNRFTVSNQLYGAENLEKRYERKDYVPLPDVPEASLSLVSSLRARKTAKDFGSKAMSLNALSGLLRWSIARDELSSGQKNFFFPSGGASYPIETYLLVRNVEGLASDIYHYASIDHSLASIEKSPQLSLETINEEYGCAFKSLPHVILYMTMVKSRIIRKYGSLSYPLCFIEAGHRGQNICLSAAALNIGVCPLGTVDYDRINAMLGIDGVNEHHIYGIAIGSLKD